ncbi:MAG: FHA domain-containing protein [Anaerolineae bacterium]|nr:FHA domain-containing protein [Anaerolineae bacterium]
MPVMCPNCAQMVDDNATFCDMCGERLQPVGASTQFPGTPVAGGTCPTCGQGYIPGEIFCNNCGVQLPPVAIGAPPPPVAVPPAPPPPAPTPAYQTPSTPAFVTGWLVVMTTNANVVIPAGKNEVLIGRADPTNPPTPDIDLTPHGGEQAGVSRRHCQLVAERSDIFIVDLNSTNHTFLNRTRLNPGQRYALKDGDELRLGKLTLFYRTS